MGHTVVVIGAGSAGAAVAEAAAAILNAIAAALAGIDRIALRAPRMSRAVGIVAAVDAQVGVANAATTVGRLLAAAVAHGADRPVRVLAAVVHAAAGYALIAHANIGAAVGVVIAAADPVEARAADFAVGVAVAVAVIAALLADVVIAAGGAEAMHCAVRAPAPGAGIATIEAEGMPVAVLIELAKAASAAVAVVGSTVAIVAALNTTASRVVAESARAFSVTGAAAAGEVIPANRGVAIAARVVDGIAGFARPPIGASANALSARGTAHCVALSVVETPPALQATVSNAAGRGRAVGITAFTVDRITDLAAAVAGADRRVAAAVAIGIAGFAGRRGRIADGRIAVAAAVIGRIAAAALAAQRARGDAELPGAAFLVGLADFAFRPGLADGLGVWTAVVIDRIADAAAAVALALVAIAQATRVVAITARARRIGGTEGLVAIGVAAVLSRRIAGRAGVGHALGGRAVAVAIVEAFDTIGARAERRIAAADRIAAFTDAIVAGVGSLRATRAVITGGAGVKVHGLTREVAAQFIGIAAGVVAGVACPAFARDALIFGARSGQAFGVVGAGGALEGRRIADRCRATTG